VAPVSNRSRVKRTVKRRPGKKPRRARVRRAAADPIGLTQKDYARSRRVSAQYINKLVRQERIQLLENGRVDPRQADEALAHSRAVTPRRRGKAGSNAHGGGRPARPAGSPRAGSATASLTAFRAEDAGYAAKLRKLELDQKLGNLLPLAEVRLAHRRVYANVRLRLRGLARTLAPVMARTMTPAECEHLLLEEIDHQLEELSQDPLASLGLVAAPQPPAVQTPAGATA
jgi:hypothetical protein